MRLEWQGRPYVADEHHVYGADPDGRIRARPLPEAPALLRRAREHFYATDPRVPGQVHGEVTSRGKLNRVEIQQLHSTDGLVAVRPMIEEHLAFFDPSGHGHISWRDNYQSWLDLGESPARALLQTVGSALVFGRRHGGVIQIADLPRPAGATGIYDDPSRLEALLQSLGPGPYPSARLQSALGRLGRVPARQFQSLFRLCRRLNGADTVTADQLRWLYDGSLLWRAARQLGTR